MNYKCDECEGKRCLSDKAVGGLECPDEKDHYHWKPLDNGFIKQEITTNQENQTPNCAICKWIKADYEFETYQVSIDDADKINQDDIGCPTNYDCMAQGGCDANGVYNNDQCKYLFEVKPTEDKND